MSRARSASTCHRVARAQSGFAHAVSGPLAEKIRKVSQRLKYLPNAAASSLRTLRTRTVGVIVPDITDPAYPPIIRGIEDALAANGYVAILANTMAMRAASSVSSRRCGRVPWMA